MRMWSQGKPHLLLAGGGVGMRIGTPQWREAIQQNLGRVETQGWGNGEEADGAHGDRLVMAAHSTVRVEHHITYSFTGYRCL